PRNRLPTQDHDAAAEQRPAEADDDAALGEVRAEQALRDEPGQDRADDPDDDVGQRARSGKRAHDPAAEPTDGGTDGSPENRDPEAHTSFQSSFRAINGNRVGSMTCGHWPART